MTRMLVCCAYFILLSSFALAESISFSYSGTVDQIFRSPPAPFTTVQVGDAIQVDYTLDVSTPDQDGVDDFGTFSGAVETYKVTIGDSSAITELGGVNTVNANGLAPQDTYAAIGIFEDFTTALSFKDASGVAMGAQDDLSTIDLSGFDDRSFTLLNGIFPSIGGTLSVPEPTSISIAFLGMISLLSHRRRRSN